MKRKCLAGILAGIMIFGNTPAYMESNAEILSIDEYYKALSEQSYMAVLPAKDIKIDGDGKDWENYPTVQAEKVRDYSGANVDITLNAKFAWDNEAFYFYAEVHDEIYRPQIGGSYWQGDSLQFCMGLPDETFGDEFGFSYDEENKKPYIALPAAINDKADLIDAAFKHDGALLKYEIKIPWNVPFEEKPEAFKFCLLAADNDGKNREYVVMMETGIEEQKRNDKFPYLIPCDENTNGISWISGETTVNTSEKAQYSINILNFNEKREYNINAPELGYSGNVTADEKSWIVIPIEYDSGEEPRVVDMYADVGENLISFHKSVKIQPTYELYKSRFEALNEQLGKIDKLLESCKNEGIYVDYEEVNANTVREFLKWTIDDLNAKDSDRVLYCIEQMEKLCDEAYSNLSGYILGTKLPYDVPHVVPNGPLEVKNGTFYGETINSEGDVEERPIYLIGYGHGDKARQDLAKFPGVGGNYIQFELGPRSYIKPAGDVPDWIGGKENALIFDEATNSNVIHLVDDSIKQSIPVRSDANYRLKFKARGSGSEIWYSLYDWNQRVYPKLTKTMAEYTHDFTAPIHGDITLRFYVKGDVYIDDVEIVRIDDNGEECAADTVVNGDFEKTESDSRFICDFSAVLGAFGTVYDAEKAGVMVSFLLSPHYFPSWVYDEYPETKIKSVRSYDISTDVVKDMYAVMGREIARVLKNFTNVNDICVHNEDRYLLYEDSKNLPLFQAFLKEKYGDISSLNSAYGTNYVGFDEIPMPNGLERSSATYDLAELTNKLVLESRKVSYEAIKSVWQEVNVSGKLQAPHVFSKDLNRFTQGLNPIGEGRVFGLHGMDGGITYNNGEFLDTTFAEGNPLSIYMLYDYVTSDISAPILNMEDHIDTDGDETCIEEIGKNSARYMWEACVHGRGSSAIWQWARTNDTSNAMVRGRITYRPDQMAKVGHTALDVNRLSNEVAALFNTKRTVQILYSRPSVNRNYVVLDAMQKAYAAASYSGQKSYILTDSDYDNINHSDLLIVPAAKYASKRLVNDILTYLNDGNEVVLLGDFCLKYDEYGRPHDEQLLNEIYAKATVIPVEEVIDDSYSYNGVNTEAHIVDNSHINIDQYELRDALRPIFEKHNLMTVQLIDADTGEITKSTAFLYTQYGDNMLLDVSYYGDYNDKKSFKVIYNGHEITNMRELRSGKLITNSVAEVEAETPLLLSFKLK